MRFIKRDTPNLDDLPAGIYAAFTPFIVNSLIAKSPLLFDGKPFYLTGSILSPEFIPYDSSDPEEKLNGCDHWLSWDDEVIATAVAELKRVLPFAPPMDLGYNRHLDDQLLENRFVLIDGEDDTVGRIICDAMFGSKSRIYSYDLIDFDFSCDNETIERYERLILSGEDFVQQSFEEQGSNGIDLFDPDIEIRIMGIDTIKRAIDILTKIQEGMVKNEPT